MEFPITKIQQSTATLNETLKEAWRHIRTYTLKKWTEGTHPLLQKSLGILLELGLQPNVSMMTCVYCIVFIENQQYWMKNWNALPLVDISEETSTILLPFLKRKYHSLLVSFLEECGRLHEVSCAIIAAYIDATYFKFNGQRELEFEFIFQNGYVPSSLLT